MRFCLATPNRDVPTAQTWRYLAPNGRDDCHTEVVTLSASPADGWKLYTSDAILFGETERSIEVEIGTNKFITVEERIRALDLGDNIAEEGVLGQIV